jgi:hypothetical protein
MGIMCCLAAFKGNSIDRSREYRRRFACGFGRGDSSRRYLDGVAVIGQPVEQRAGLPLYALSSIRSSNGRLERPRVRSKSTGRELPLPSGQEAAEGGWLEEWPMSLMLKYVATRKFGRAVRLPEAGISAAAGSGCRNPRSRGASRR